MNHDIVVIGAGAGGLALGHHLARAGRDFVIVERGRVGESWRRMPEDVQLLSPWWTNVLPGTPVPLARALAKVSSAEYAVYLERYAAGSGLPVREQCAVTAVSPGSAGTLEVHTGGGVLRARAVVCACGYYQNPYIPGLPEGDDASIPFLHAASYRGADALRASHPQCRRVLVVGRRITAGQLMVELHDAGYEVALASRGTVRMRAEWRKWRLKEELYFLYERLFVRLFPEVRAEERPIMDGGRTRELLRSGQVRKVGGLRRIAGGRVEFMEGEPWACDLVLFATGYRPALGFLEPAVPLGEAGLPRLTGMGSADLPGLHFLGLENLRNFLSPYLRGLAADARILAPRL